MRPPREVASLDVVWFWTETSIVMTVMLHCMKDLDKVSLGDGEGVV